MNNSHKNKEEDKTSDKIPDVITEETCKPCSDYQKCTQKECPLYRYIGR